MCSYFIKLLTILTILCIAVTPICGSNILGLFTSHSPSHLIIHMSVAKALAERGHNVTVITGLKPTVTHKNITVIIIPPEPEKYKEFESLMDQISKKESTTMSFFNNTLVETLMAMVELQKDILKTEQFKTFFNTPDTHFDLVIYGYFMNDFLLGVAAKYKCPVVIDWSGPPMDQTNLFIGNPVEVAYVPNSYSKIKPGSVLTFRERLENFVYSFFMQVGPEIAKYYNKKFYEEYFPKDFPTIDEMRQNVSLLFSSHHFSEGPIRPNVPAYIEIGGIQIKDKPDPLPKDIDEFLAKSKEHGAIYFALGSNLKMSAMLSETITAFFNTLSSIKQNVIWKWDDLENLPGKSTNILFKNWVPQDDILAHPNVKLFITHAGRGGIVEAQYHGVPMVAIPFFADQHFNAVQMVGSGYGTEMLISELTEENFKGAILEVLNNPKYTENIKRFSVLYRDRPMAAKESVVYWTEYVIRYHGAPHMQSPLVQMNFIQKTSLDVISFLLFLLYVSFVSLRYILRQIFKFLKKIFSKTKKVKRN